MEVMNKAMLLAASQNKTMQLLTSILTEASYLKRSHVDGPQVSIDKGLIYKGLPVRKI